MLAQEELGLGARVQRRYALRMSRSLILLSAFLAGSVAVSSQPARTALRFGTLVNGLGQSTRDAVVVVSADRIVSVGSGDRAVPKDATVVDLRPLTAVPGLIDAHTHMMYVWDPASGTSPLRQARREPALTVEVASANARRTLEAGVTTVRDLGASGGTDYTLRDRIAGGAVVGPRMFVAGQGISAGRGGGPGAGAMAGPVETRVKAGSDWIKVYASRGSYQSVDTTQTLTFDEMKAIVDAAHALKRRVAIHSYGASGVKDAVRAGADSVEHGIELDDETLAMMRRQGTVWVPTVDHNRYYIDAKDEYGFAPETIPPLLDYLTKNLDAVRRAVKAGVPIAMGSDAVYSMFGQNTRELGWFVKAGMTPAQALASATTIPARMLGREKELGVVAPGYYADIVAVDGDPLRDIDVVINKVKWVMKGGAVVRPQTPSVPSGLAPYVTLNAPTVALTHVRLVDGTGAPAREDQTVILNGAEIAAVGPSASTALPDGARVIDLSNHTLLPGLVGLHEHTYFGGVKRLTQMSVSGPLLYLASGVTSAMTAGSMFPYQELNLKRAVDAQALPGPRFFVTGPYLNGGPPRNTMSHIVTSPEDVRRAIAYWAGEGATWFKFQGQVTRDVLRSGIEAAHARGLRVTGHLCSITFTEAAELGIDALQHGFITNSDYVPTKAPDVCPPENMRIQADVEVTDPAVQASIGAIVARKVAVVATLGVYETFMPDRARLNPQALDVLDPETRQEVEATHAGLARSPLVVPARLLQKMMQWERAFAAAGGLLGAGSDPWGTGFLPGFGNLRNYELLVEAGFTAEQAIQILTLNGARILGEEARFGSIAPGKRADLVVIQGNPLRTPSEIYSVITVFKDGIGYGSAALRAGARGRVGVN